MSEPLFLHDVQKAGPGPDKAELLRMIRESGSPLPPIYRLFAYKPERSEALARFTQAVMRGPSPLPPWQRELLAALASGRNHCPY